jgi:hypothetical protein
MSLNFASWIHGNALVVEGDPLEYFETTEQTKIEKDDPLSSSAPGYRVEFGETIAHEVRPRLSINHLGWGTVVGMFPGSAQWFHIPIPTPVIVDDRRLEMVRFFLFWQIEGNGELAKVDLYDAGVRLFPGFKPKAVYLPYGPGQHLHIDAYSTFELMQPPAGKFGFGISFLVKCTGPTKLTVTAAGADFQYTSE